MASSTKRKIEIDEDDSIHPSNKRRTEGVAAAPLSQDESSIPNPFAATTAFKLGCDEVSMELEQCAGGEDAAADAPEQFLDILDLLPPRRPSSFIYREDAPKTFTPIIDPSGNQIGKIVPVDMQSLEALNIIEYWNNELISYNRQYNYMGMGMPIRKISRVQNDIAKMRYEHLQLEGSSRQQEPLTVYHTTNSPIDTVVMEGLDQRLSKSGYFGRGIYFSDPIKCSMYGKFGTTTHRVMLMCSILPGRQFTFLDNEHDNTLLREPAGYDSVSGNITGHREHVIYNNDRCIIDYIIEYDMSNLLQGEITWQSHRYMFQVKNPTLQLPDHLTTLQKYAQHVMSQKNSIPLLPPGLLPPATMKLAPTSTQSLLQPFVLAPVPASAGAAAGAASASASAASGNLAPPQPHIALETLPPELRYTVAFNSPRRRIVQKK